MIEDIAGKGIVGHVKYEAFDADGKMIYFKEHDKELGQHNTVCDLYYDLIADLMAGGSDDVIAYGHCGTSTGQSATDTNLATYVDEVRTAIDSSTQSGDHLVTFITTFGAGVCTAAITEVGMFVASAQATADMMLYDDSIAYTKGASDSLVVTWTVTHAN